MRVVAGISRQEEYRVSTKEMLCHMTFLVGQRVSALLLFLTQVKILQGKWCVGGETRYPG